nr:transposase [Veronia pacifica]
MKKSRFTESQSVSILKEADAGMKEDDICRQHGISKATYYYWKTLAMRCLVKGEVGPAAQAAQFKSGSRGFSLIQCSFSPGVWRFTVLSSHLRA